MNATALRKRQATDLRTHVIWLPQSTVMAIATRARARRPKLESDQRYLITLVAYLDAAIQTSGGAAIVELKGTRNQFERMLAAGGDMTSAVEVGAQLGIEPC